MHSINHSFHSFDWSNNIFLFIFSLVQTHTKAKGTSMMDTSANWAILRTYPNSYVITSTCWETIDPSSTPTMSASNPPSDCTRKLSISGHIWQVSNQSAHRHWKPVARELASWQLSLSWYQLCRHWQHYCLSLWQTRKLSISGHTWQVSKQSTRCYIRTENQWRKSWHHDSSRWELSWCQLCRHWQHYCLSLWQSALAPVTTNRDSAMTTYCIYFCQAHDDVIKWKLFPRYWPFVWEIHRSPVNSPHKGQWRGALMFTLICARINGWVNNR